jgi:hypothetical protein
VDDPQILEGAGGVSQAVATPAATKEFTLWQRVHGWITNPWGKPRFLVVITWGYIFWSIAPVLVAIQFSFNNSRSLSVWHGFTTKWYLTDPLYSVRYSPDLRGALAQSMKLAVLDVVIATPIGVARSTKKYGITPRSSGGGGEGRRGRCARRSARPRSRGRRRSGGTDDGAAGCQWTAPTRFPTSRGRPAAPGSGTAIPT